MSLGSDQGAEVVAVGNNFGGEKVAARFAQPTALQSVPEVVITAPAAPMNFEDQGATEEVVGDNVGGEKVAPEGGVYAI